MSYLKSRTSPTRFSRLFYRELGQPIQYHISLAEAERFELSSLVLETSILAVELCFYMYFLELRVDFEPTINGFAIRFLNHSDISTSIYNIKNVRFADFKVKLKSQPLCFTSENLTAKSASPRRELPDNLSLANQQDLHLHLFKNSHSSAYYLYDSQHVVQTQRSTQYFCDNWLH